MTVDPSSQQIRLAAIEIHDTQVMQPLELSWPASALLVVRARERETCYTVLWLALPDQWRV